MSQFNLKNKIRKHLLSFSPYSSARDEFKGSGKNYVFLDANENPYGSPATTPLNRYPDPYQSIAKEKIADYKRLNAKNIFLGNGSDEIIDLTMRLFCEPKQDSILVLSPSYGMYTVAANINNIEVIEVALKNDFTTDADTILSKINANTKIIFLCSPNNPTGMSLDKGTINKILNNFDGIVFIDEAYIDFSVHKSMIYEVDNYNNLIVCQTFSKAWGLAGTRLGLGICNSHLVSYLNRIKPPYNVNSMTQRIITEALDNVKKVEQWIIDINKNKLFLVKQLSTIPQVKHICQSDANFIFAKFELCNSLYTYLSRKDVIVRNRSHIFLCDEYMRITVGTMDEISKLLKQINLFYE